MTLDPGTTLGSYEVLGPLGAGGMGEVYRALDRKLGREVAVKILPAAFSQDPARLVRFDREARMLASVNHPALAAIYGLEQEGPLRYIVMELVPGETLAEMLSRGPAPLRETLSIARQIAEGLAAAHDKGIVHRDLKPANVKVTPEGRVKVLDLGLAKAMDPKSSESSDASDAPTLRMDETRPGVIVGTVEFMSPEQARGRPVDKRTDVWAFGCVLFEMLSAHRAFSGETPSDALAAILTQDPDWSALPASTPPRVRELLERCLQKDPNRRLRDLGDARLVLEDAALESSERRPMPWAEPANPRDRRVVLATLAMLAVAAGVWLALRPPRAAGAAVARSLAVLPFRDLSGVPGGDRVGDGMVETVSTRLSNVPGVSVVTPAAAVSAADAGGDIFRLGRDLGANLVLRGAVQRQGDRIRITYSVWNIQTRAQVAAGDVTGSAADLFGIQDQLAERVARDLRLPTPSRRTPPPTGLVTSGEQERYLQALGYLQRYDRPDSVRAAVGLLEGLAREAPGSALVHAALARAYLHEHTLTHDREWATRAAAAADRAARLDPGLPDVHATRGLVATRTGRGAEAIAEFQIALSQSPNSLEALFGLADACASVGRNEEAEAALRRAVALQPDYWAVYNRLGSFQYELGRYARAAEQFRRAAEKAPDSVRAWNNLGAAYQQNDQFDEALAAYTRSAAVRPNDGAYSNLGTLQFFLGRYKESAEAFEKATEVTPDKALYWANLGDAYRWAPGMRSKAPAAYARAIALARERLHLDPDDAAAHATLGLCLAKNGAAADGLAEIRRALEKEPGNPDYLYDAAVVSTLLGKTDDAVGWLRQAVNGGLGIRQVESEPEFESLRRLDAYKKIFEAGKKAA